MFKEKLTVIGRVLSLTLLVVTIGLIITAFIRARRQPRPPGPVRSESKLKANVTAITEGYKYIRTEKGRETVRLLAVRDVAYEDGRHEMEKVDLTAFGKDPGKSIRIVSDHGSWVSDQNVVTFEGNVKVISSDGLEVSTPALKYDQLNEVASTESAVAFKQADLSGSSVGAQLYAKTRNLALLNNVRLVSTRLSADPKGGLPVEIRSGKADYAELDGVVRFSGNAYAVQGGKSARADLITGVINPVTKKIARIEMRGNSAMKSDEEGRRSDITARDIDFHFDPAQHLTAAIGSGGARAISFEKDAPREITAARIEAIYAPFGSETRLRSVVTQGRTTLRIEAADGEGSAKVITERILEADFVESTFRDDGKSISSTEARGNSVLTITPKRVTAVSDRKILRAASMAAEFAERGNLIRSFNASGNVVAEFEPQQPGSKRNKRTMSGQKMTANISVETQEVTDLTVDGSAKFTDGDRHATAQQAIYDSNSQIVSLRGKPQLWDASARGSADEIDANLDTGQSFLRGRVRTTYFSRESTGGAAPFKNRNAPITIASERAVYRHRESAARFTGNVRAWQDNDFVRAENMELDKGEKSMSAWGNAQSAFYDFEREMSEGKKDVVPVFASADRINYNGESRTAHYEGTVRIRQGTDRIDAAKADAIMNDENRLVTMSATGNVVLSQPVRRATGEKVVYTVATDTVELTGKQAMVEDLESKSVTKSAKLTLHFRDARIEAIDDDGTKARVRTTHRIPK
ncbi:MAG: LPS export ABC transporter periplasmic protein LptC [Acidobacteria bacterium]|nr:LPS export ABC transporter periplasmic protein LptC [Acidobacteriota bacterium]